jgi:chemotaxis protein histidine kinase CheA
VTQDIEDGLGQLRQRFASSLPERLAAVETKLVQWRREPAAVNHIEALHLLVHGLSGSGAIFGFAALSAAAKELEAILEPLRKRERDITTETLREIEALWDHVKHAAKAGTIEKNT